MAKKIPIGIDDFKKIRESVFYYVDKTKLIENLINNCGKVNIFTRPRRFGKSLNMSMLKCFFEIGTDTSLFNDLYISNNIKLCEKHLGKYPVISLTLKNIDGLNFNEALNGFVEIIGHEAERFDFLLDSDRLSPSDKERYGSLIAINNGKYSMDKRMLVTSLESLSYLLYKHYNQRVIILIDEYETPLYNAFNSGYYDEMVSLIMSMYANALKGNEALEFAVLTGCLRLPQRIIYGGFNNFRYLSILDSRFNDSFGFTENEVKDLLTYYNYEEYFPETKQWYDGYRFGDIDIYCPWDVISYVDLLNISSNKTPKSFWINTSSNDLVKRFIYMADKTTRDDIERLVAGEVIEKEVHLELTYDEIDNSIDNLWSVLFTTGYLTQVGVNDNGYYKLKIPNEEIRTVYKKQIREWFNTTIQEDSNSLNKLWDDFKDSNCEGIENYLNKTLDNTISIFDTKSHNGKKEYAYHMFLTGILSTNRNWIVKSNLESGDGLADLIIETDNYNNGIVIEIKHSLTYDDMNNSCLEALNQIKDKRYDTYLRNEGRNDILIYGIAFCKKRCKVVVEKL
ncbi:MAG: AAA family ATPase [Erysipelotrichaceae bacterium]|nr:ATP-binding protein [Solobacterium sp.]MDY4792209.1 AAA family ATPase [Erysipelotrichaceae bacterium]